MSGHSKWSTIKRKKGAADAKRGKLFTKFIREITIAAREGGGDPEGNPRLRTAIDKAKASNMPNDNIDRGIKKGTGDLEGVSYEEIVYEGYGPGGVAIMLDVLTDNRNRALADIRHILTKNNGNLGENGCVSWLFEKRGLIQFDRGSVDEDSLMEVALEAGADDISEDEDVLEVLTEPSAMQSVRQALVEAGLEPASAEVTSIPQSTVKLTGKQAGQMLRMMDMLEDCDDIQNVWANFDISDEEMEALG
ncbi:MAG: YebC/PmpR family DNA-binding transcriptional regulator [Candidatus Alcyoniella australis]|nr:YebC/PmpR family DNA-binding transcriptional regulator [Candidatus Alcyoniella australis]